MRLIDADALYKTLEWEFYQSSNAINDIGKSILGKVYKTIIDAPTIESEQHWIPVEERLPKAYREKNCQQEEMTFKLNNPLTEEQWDAITDVDMEHTPMIEFHTKNGKIVKYRKVEEE